MEQSNHLKKLKIDSIRNSLKSNPIYRFNTIKISQKQETIQNQTLIDQSLSWDSSEEYQLVEIVNIKKNVSQNESQNTVNDITVFQQKYQLLEKLGQGSNGVVRKCLQKKTRQIYAVKMSSIEDQHIVNLRTIFKTVKNLDHPNIIKYKQMYIDTQKHACFLVMQYFEFPSLRKFNKNFSLTEQQIKNIIKQILKAISYLHIHKICHRDLKLDNILFNQQLGKIIIIDFGISTITMDRGKYKQMWSSTGTIHYKAPEMLSGGGYDQKVDDWAVGIILFELITGQTPFYSQYLSDEIQNILNLNYKFDQQIWLKYSKFAKDLVTKLLRHKKTRFSAQECLRVVWFLGNTDNLVLEGTSLNFEFEKRESVQVEQQNLSQQNELDRKKIRFNKLFGMQKNLKDNLIITTNEKDIITI